VTTGIVSDIHLELDALRRTLDGPLASCDDIVVLGDVLDRGPGRPFDVFELLLARPRTTILVGNHELAYLGGRRFPGMVEERNLSFRSTLRDMVLDGRVVAAAARGDVLLVHGGLSRSFWERHVRERWGSDVRAIARGLSLQLLRAVTQRDFSDPVFNAIDTPLPGPFWAGVSEHLLSADSLPPLAQVVGHARVPDLGWVTLGAGSVHPLLGPPRTDGLLDHMVLEELDPG
jgi:hypothetical protein